MIRLFCTHTSMVILVATTALQALSALLSLSAVILVQAVPTPFSLDDTFSTVKRHIDLLGPCSDPLSEQIDNWDPHK
ncbi:hypothetical protein F5H01DRAFT_340436 [Linnemannia elongata]|nr:hypothetical protein F5H01DRAFT_340436 [Linnemannia elongata]